MSPTVATGGASGRGNCGHHSGDGSDDPGDNGNGDDGGGGGGGGDGGGDGGGGGGDGGDDDGDSSSDNREPNGRRANYSSTIGTADDAAVSCNASCKTNNSENIQDYDDLNIMADDEEDNQEDDRLLRYPLSITERPDGDEKTRKATRERSKDGSKAMDTKAPKATTGDRLQPDKRFPLLGTGALGNGSVPRTRT